MTILSKKVLALLQSSWISLLRIQHIQIQHFCLLFLFNFTTKWPFILKILHGKSGNTKFFCTLFLEKICVSVKNFSHYFKEFIIFHNKIKIFQEPIHFLDICQTNYNYDKEVYFEDMFLLVWHWFHIWIAISKM